MDKIFEKAIEIGKEIAKIAIVECDGTYEGEEKESQLKLGDLIYKAKFYIFWESVNHFDCSVECVNNDYKNEECCILF